MAQGSEQLGSLLEEFKKATRATAGQAQRKMCPASLLSALGPLQSAMTDLGISEGTEAAATNFIRAILLSVAGCGCEDDDVSSLSEDSEAAMAIVPDDHRNSCPRAEELLGESTSCPESHRTVPGVQEGGCPIPFDEKLFERLGSWEVLVVAVEMMYQRLSSDPHTASIYAAVDKQRLTQKQTSFIAWALQGKRARGLTPLELYKLHRPYFRSMGLNAQHVDIMVGHMKHCLSELGMSNETVESATAVLLDQKWVFDPHYAQHFEEAMAKEQHEEKELV